MFFSMTAFNNAISPSPVPVFQTAMAPEVVGCPFKGGGKKQDQAAALLFVEFHVKIVIEQKISGPDNRE